MSAEPQRQTPISHISTSAVAQGAQHRSANASHSIQRLRGELALPTNFVLESGASLNQGTLAWECVGPAESPLIIVLGGISAHRQLCADEAAGRSGWWQSQCGPGRALDTDRHRLLSIDWLGGCDASTGPRHAEGTVFPAISTADQARALLLLLNRLGVRRVHLLVGASYGGNVAQQLAALLGERLRGLVLLSAAHRPSQFGLALRHIQRTILDLGGNDSPAALALARSLAVLGYRTTEGVEQRFADARDGAGVEAWLDHHGTRFVQRFDANAYRCLGRSLDAHSVDPATISAPTTVFAVREDLTVPISLLREYAQLAAGKCDLVEISSHFGHDAFLKEESIVAKLLAAAVEASA